MTLRSARLFVQPQGEFNRNQPQTLVHGSLGLLTTKYRDF